jgi:Carboxypeptidase regulatory-like domain
MKRSFAIIFLAAAFCAATLSLFADDVQGSTVKITVVREASGKPVGGAAVVLHPVGKDGKQSHGGAELKTTQQGTATLPSVPYGKVRVQVIAHGLQTFGDDFDISQPEQEILIKLKPPQQQHSIYK